MTGLSEVQGIAYDSTKGEIFAGNSVISDSNNAVVAQVPNVLASVVYDSGKGEIIGSTPAALDIFSDSSSTSTSTTTTSSATATTPTSITSQISTTTQSSASSTTGGGIPEFPAQLGFTFLATVAIVMAYVFARRGLRMGKQDPI